MHLLLFSAVRTSQTDTTSSLSLAGGPIVGPDAATSHSFCKFISFKRSGSLVVKVLQTSKILLRKMENTATVENAGARSREELSSLSTSCGD